MDDEAGEAAHTGTAAGRVIELFHDGKSLEEALRQCKVEAFNPPDPFGDADWTDVEAVCSDYVKDPRNKDCVLDCEGTCEGEIDDVYFRGHYDQVRLTCGRKAIWDLKNGGKKAGPWNTGTAMTMNYALQLAAYSTFVGADCGGIIRLQDYVKKSVGAVFYSLPLTSRQCRILLEQVAEDIRNIRRGRFVARPATNCSYCSLSWPDCMALLERI